MRSLSVKTILTALCSSVLAFCGFVFLTSPAAADTFSCTNYNLPVNLSATDPTVYHVFGQLCSQGSVTGKTVQFVIHGITYDHNYMDWPLDPQKYSYVRKATDSGYATFNIDRIGIGNSDHPLSTLVNLESNSFVVHELIQDLTQGTIGGNAFSSIVLVGHSFGSAISVQEEATFKDPSVKGLILSGFDHQINPNFLPLTATDFHPTFLDPKFANSNFPGLYITSVPGVRGSIFYNQSDADPNVVALDEQLKQTATDGELATIGASLDPTFSLQIEVPVLIANGQDDFLFCNPSIGLSCADSQAILQRENANFSPHACLEAFVLANAGHDVNLHFNAHDFFEFANSWVNRRVGPSNSTPPTQPCS